MLNFRKLFSCQSHNYIITYLSSFVNHLCEQALELIAPLCDLWSPQGLKVHIRQAFSSQFKMLRDLEFGKELNPDE